MQYSPKLKKAMEEIKKVIDSYDIAASVVLADPGFGEYYFKINPSWSAARIEIVNQEPRFRVNIKAEHYKGDKARRDKVVGDTVNMLMHLSTITGQVAMSLIDMSKKIEEYVEAEHGPGNHSSNIEQNN